MKLFFSSSDKKILKKIVSNFPEIKEILIVSNEGLPLKSTLSQKIEHVKIAGISLAMLSAAKTLVHETLNGKFKQFLIKCSEGYIIGMWLNPTKLVFVFSKNEIDLNSIL